MEVNSSALYLQLKGMYIYTYIYIAERLSTNTYICMNYLLKYRIDIVLTSAVIEKRTIVSVQVTKI
jgi:hypothetical protein